MLVAHCLVWLGAVLSVPAWAGPRPTWNVIESDRAGQWSIFGRTRGGSDLGLPLAAGDFNGDHLADIIVTPMNADSGPMRERDRAGEAIIVLSSGTIAGFVDLATFTLDAVPPSVTVLFGADALDFFGTEVFAADLDGDGFDEAIVGAQQGDGPGNARPGAGDVAIVWGNDAIGGRVIDLQATAGTAVTMVYGAASGDRLGVWVGAGDVDGDGTVDALLGADQANGPDGARSDAGHTYVVYGGAALRAQGSVDLAVPSVATTVIYGIDDDDHSGCTVRGADLDGDGAAEILIGAGLNRLSATAGGGESMGGGDGPDEERRNAGEAYVVYGEVGTRPSAIDLRSPPSSTVIIYGADEGDVYGEELFGGDFNGDGFGDVLVGALTADGPFNGRHDAGETALVLGSAALRGSRIDLAAPPANVTIFYGASQSNISGDTAMFADINDDGRDELVIGSPQDNANNRSNAGAVDIFFGSDQALPASVDLAAPPVEHTPYRVLGADTGDMLAYSMHLGDVDGDAIVDLVINAMGGDGVGNLLPNAGDAYVLSGALVSEAAGRATPRPTPTPSPTASVSPTPTATPACAGDCDGTGAVTIDELIRAVGVALDTQPITVCLPADLDGDGTIRVNELVTAVDAALNGCG